MLGLVREAGGIGDVICLGAAARAIKKQGYPEEVVVFVPHEFVAIAQRLRYVDEVISLGPLKEITPHRRQRDAEMHDKLYPYLEPAVKWQRRYNAQLVSMFCPGFLYENSQPGKLEYNRPQLFAMAAGVQDVSDVHPAWCIRLEDHDEASKCLAPLGMSNLPLVAVQLRGTCAARSFPEEARLELIKRLIPICHPLIFDCVQLPFEVPAGATGIVGLPIDTVAAILCRCKVALCVDSCFIHLAAALNRSAIGIFGPTDGEVITQTYAGHIALDGRSTRCIRPCSYNHQKGWTRNCRSTGCARMFSHVDHMNGIVDAVQRALEEGLWQLVL